MFNLKIRPKRPPKVVTPASSKLLAVADTFGFDVLIKRSARRRTIEIIIRAGKVQLMMPQFVAEAEGLAFVYSKREWIIATLEKHESVLDTIPVKEYKNGELFEYLGAPYPLEIFRSTKPHVLFNGTSLHVGIRTCSAELQPQLIKKALTQWYRDQAQTILEAKTRTCAARIKREVKAVKLRATKTKWGHCTSDGVIQYNWQIIAAPEWVIDYLVAHEVSHLVHRHHRPIFWRHVEKLHVNYREAKLWLKENGSHITF